MSFSSVVAQPFLHALPRDEVVYDVEAIPCNNDDLPLVATVPQLHRPLLSNVEASLAYSRAEFLYARLPKPTRDAKIGLFFINRPQGGVALSRVLGIPSNLQVGDRIVSVNQQDCLEFSAKQVAQLIADAPSGHVHIIVHHAGGGHGLVSTYVRKEPDAKARVVLKTHRGALVVSKVHRDGPLYGTPICPGHRLLWINGVPCEGLGLSQAVRLIKESEHLILVTQPRPETAMVLTSGADSHRKWWQGIMVGAGLAAAFAVNLH